MAHKDANSKQAICVICMTPSRRWWRNSVILVVGWCGRSALRWTAPYADFGLGILEIGVVGVCHEHHDLADVKWGADSSRPANGGATIPAR